MVTVDGIEVEEELDEHLVERGLEVVEVPRGVAVEHVPVGTDHLVVLPEETTRRSPEARGSSGMAASVGCLSSTNGMMVRRRPKWTWS